MTIVNSSHNSLCCALSNSVEGIYSNLHNLQANKVHRDLNHRSMIVDIIYMRYRRSILT